MSDVLPLIALGASVLGLAANACTFVMLRRLKKRAAAMTVQHPAFGSVPESMAIVGPDGGPMLVDGRLTLHGLSPIYVDLGILPVTTREAAQRRAGR